jgi:2-polyprenyl-6-methoxyphenol hydroxylase-like FAD-dependent oxidoreductase
MDRFANAKSGEEALAILKQVVADLFPWDAAFVRDMTLADPLGWLVGRVVPTVRRPAACLGSGRVVAALGDTAISYDPIAAQGANSGIKQAQHLVAAVRARGDRPFDEWWMTETFESFYNDHAHAAFEFSNLLLEPITAPAKELLIAQYGSDGRIDNHGAKQRIADAFFENFNDPRTLTPAFTDMHLARQTIGALSGRRWLWSGMRGRAAIARDQVRQRLRN